MKGQVQFFQAMGSIALVEDIIILCLPIPVFWKLQINSRQKIALTMVFSLGGLYGPRRLIYRSLLTDGWQSLYFQSDAPH